MSPEIRAKIQAAYSARAVAQQRAIDHENAVAAVAVAVTTEAATKEARAAADVEARTATEAAVAALATELGGLTP